MLGSSGTGQYGQFPTVAGQMASGNTASALAALGQATMGGGNIQSLHGNFATLANLQAAGRTAQAAALGQQRLGGTAGLGPSLQQQLLGQGAPPGRLPGVPGAGQQQPQQQQQFAGMNGLAGRAGMGMGGAGLGAPAGAAGLAGLNPALAQQAAAAGLGRPAGAFGQLQPGLGSAGGFGGLAALQRAGAAAQGGAGGLTALGGRLGGLGGLGAAASSYGAPSGDLLSMLNKAGGVRPQHGGAHGEGPSSGGEGPAFDASDFPSLSQATAGAGGAPRSGDGPVAAGESFAALVGSQKAGGGGLQGPSFQEEDFPALPGSGGAAGAMRQDGSEGAAQLQALQAQVGGLGAGAGGDAALDVLRLQQQRQLQQQAALKGGVLPGGADAAGAGAAGKLGVAPQPDRFGLLGLLSVIRMTDPDLTTLALGTDLTTLGLNLNSPEALWKTFSSPWADAPGKPEPEFKPGYFSKFQPDTLFYIFYGLPGDEAQLYAADELSSRGWYYHKEYKAWLTRAPNTEPLQKTDRFERGSFFLFDPASWEVVRKDNFVVHFSELERAPNLAAHAAAAAAAATGVSPQQPMSPVK
eukprot:scaffold15.g4208.t1